MTHRKIWVSLQHFMSSLSILTVTKTELSPELVTPTVSHEFKVSESEAELDSQNIINNEIEVLKSIYTVWMLIYSKNE